MSLCLLFGTGSGSIKALTPHTLLAPRAAGRYHFQVLPLEKVNFHALLLVVIHKRDEVIQTASASESTRCICHRAAAAKQEVTRLREVTIDKRERLQLS